MTTSSPDLTACTSRELGNWLLEHRFSNDRTALVAFLQATLEAISDTPSGTKDGSSGPESSTAVDLGDCQVQTEVSLTAPRVKASLQCCMEGLRFTDKKGESLVVSATNQSMMVIFPKPEDCKRKKAGDMVLIIPNEPVQYKKKNLAQICFQLPNVSPEKENNQQDKEDATDPWITLLSRSLSLESGSVARVGNPSQPTKTLSSLYQYQSHQENNTSTTTGGMPFVKCYHGVNDGVLYPMKEGLLFFKPPFFLPRSEMESIGCGRDNGSRYVDLSVTKAKDEQIEFTNIHRSEVNELRDYINQVLIPAMKADVSDAGEAMVVVADAPDDDAVAAVEVEESAPASSNHRGRKRRMASMEAERVNKQAVLNDSDDEEADLDYISSGVTGPDNEDDLEHDTDEDGDYENDNDSVEMTHVDEGDDETESEAED